MGEVRQLPNAELIAWQVYFGRMAQREELANRRAARGSRHG